MSDAIDRQAAIDAIMGQPPEPHYPTWYAAQIEKLPAVQPEQNGKWIYNSPTTMKCDRCGFAIKDWDWHRFKFCPNCRADMKEVQ